MPRLWLKHVETDRPYHSAQQKPVDVGTSLPVVLISFMALRGLSPGHLTEDTAMWRWCPPKIMFP